MDKNNTYSVVLIEDEETYRNNVIKILQRQIKKQQIDFESVGDGRQGFQIIEQNNRQGKKTLAIIDIILPDINGDKLIAKAKVNSNYITGVLVSAHKSKQELEVIKKHNDWIKQTFVKPTQEDEIENIVARFIEDENQSLVVTTNNEFDYEKFQPELASYLKREAGEIKIIMKRTIESALELGRRLIIIKDKLPYGEFNLWTDRELGIHRATAAYFMRVWETFGDCRETIARSGLNVSILYFLSSSTIPEDFRSKIIELSTKGKKISFAEVKQLKKEYDLRQKYRTQATDKSSENQNAIITIDIPSNEKSTKPSPEKQQILRIVPREPKTETEHFFELGAHLLYCGSPQSPDFIARLPNHIALSVVFLNTSAWGDRTTSLPPIQATYELLFRNNNVNTTSEQREQDLLDIKNLIKTSIERFTDYQENILFSFLPYPELLILADQLKCKCSLAEPDIERCNNIIKVWQTYKKLHN